MSSKWYLPSQLNVTGSYVTGAVVTSKPAEVLPTPCEVASDGPWDIEGVVCVDCSTASDVDCVICTVDWSPGGTSVAFSPGQYSPRKPQHNALWIFHDIFSAKNSEKILHSSPVRASYRVSFVSSYSGQSFSFFPFVLCSIDRVVSRLYSIWIE